ncbi:MAG: pyruvate kinase, partial [Pyrinomonadaceae bacterium]
MRKAKILATLGPSSNEQSIIEIMIHNGLNAARINMSHGTREEHQETIKMARAAAQALDKPLSILVDLSGPKIRTRTLTGGVPVEIKEGGRFVITGRDVEGNAHEVSTNFDRLSEVVEPGARILIDDGAIELMVESTSGQDVTSRVVTGGILSERKGINLPNTALPIPSMTEKDHDDLQWAIEQNVDYIALSFVRTAQDCKQVKDIIKKLNKRELGRA